MASRRLLLAQMASLAKWIPYTEYAPLYNSLVPTTIDGKSVRNKARVLSIAGNSVVANQLAKLARQTETISGITFTRIDDYTFSLDGTATDDITSRSLEYSYRDVDTTHKYLISGISGGSAATYFYAINRFVDIFNDGIYSPTSSGSSRFNMTIKSGTTFNNKVFHIQLIDLTQLNPFVASWSLLTPQVQKILSMGYIPQNSGEIKSVDISEFSSQPYNLLSLDRTAGTLSGFSYTTPRTFEEGKYYLGLADNNYYSYVSIDSFSKTDNSITIQVNNGGYGVAFPFKIIPNKSYTLETNEPYPKAISWYDENGNYISENYTNSQKTINGQAPNNAYWGVIVLRPSVNTSYTYSNICFHLTGTRTGYAPYTSPQTLPFKYQGNGVGTSHDTLVRTDTEWIFTRNIGVVDLGTLNWGYNPQSGSERFVSSSLLSLINTSPDAYTHILCSKYEVVSAGSVIGHTKDKIISNITGYISVYDSSAGTDPAAFKAAMSGVMLYYELATPQVITIPRKHLACVDLGSLYWNQRAGSNIFYSTGATQLKTGGALYCLLYLQDTINQAANIPNMSMWNRTEGYGPHSVVIRNDSCADATAFKTAMSGIYLFFETEDEVADIDFKLDVEAGGTLNADGDVLANVAFGFKCR